MKNSLKHLPIKAESVKSSVKSVTILLDKQLNTVNRQQSHAGKVFRKNFDNSTLREHMLKSEIGELKIELQKERESQRRLLRRTMDLGQEANLLDDPMRNSSLDISRLQYKKFCSGIGMIILDFHPFWSIF